MVAAGTAAGALVASDDAPRCPGRSRGCIQAATRYLPWAELLKRVFDLDLVCPRCSGHLRIIAMIEDPTAVRDILDSLRLPSAVPVPARARSPTLFV
jgi:hypothetical protein